MKSDFLLTTRTGRELFAAVETLPIVDWHNHLPVEELATDRRYRNLTELWIASDPYKHRAMRICGVEERRITGNAEDYDKFLAWSETVPKLIGNPLYDWSRLELSRVFGIERELSPDTAADVWREANAQLKLPEFSIHFLLKKFRVSYAAPCIPTTGDPERLAGEDAVVPSLRGDDATALAPETVTELARLTGIAIDSLATLTEALTQRVEAFHRAGCRFADHALDAGFVYRSDDGRNEERFRKLTANGLAPEERAHLESAVLRALAAEYARRRWVMQLHIGALRNTSSRLRRLAGPAGGFAGIASRCDTVSLAAMLDDFERGAAGLPRTILYTLNPADHAPLAVLSGSFAEDGVAGKVQLGPAWWYCDHLYGMRDCFETVAAFGVLSVFPGMTTDSRSPLSFVRHEYFRRAFCGWLGEKAERGEYPADPEALQQLAIAVCGGNAERIVRETKGMES